MIQQLHENQTLRNTLRKSSLVSFIEAAAIELHSNESGQEQMLPLCGDIRFDEQSLYGAGYRVF